ncbi:MAG: hypothetical protein IPK74_39340 [Deltaproteobacteria bacterium]|nr:hypothetical protein [Deltaproteobacteria bacterium]
MKACKESLDTIVKLKGKVKPKDAEDHQITSLEGNLPPTSPAASDVRETARPPAN